MPQKTIASSGFEPANLGSNGKHANHYTTQTTVLDHTNIEGVDISIKTSK
jgi:hypothetical protein